MAKSASMTVEVALPPEQAEAAVYQAFLQTGLIGVTGGGGVMVAEAGLSWSGWGEKVRATIGHGPHGAVVDLYSESALPTVLFDGGKNRKNLEKVVAVLRGLVPVV